MDRPQSRAFYGLILALFLLDQIVLWALLRWYPDLVHLSPNRWFYGGYPWSLMASLILLAIIWPLKNGDPRPKALLTIGLTSNLLCYIRFGVVPDYIPIGPWYSNLADLFIILGIIWLVSNSRQPKNGPQAV